MSDFDRLGKLQLSDFARHLGEIFEVTRDDGSVLQLHLDEVRPLSERAGSGHHRAPSSDTVDTTAGSPAR